MQPKIHSTYMWLSFSVFYLLKFCLFCFLLYLMEILFLNLLTEPAMMEVFVFFATELQA